MKSPQPNSSSIVNIILFAAIGYVLFPLLIKSQLIQYTTPPKNLYIGVHDDLLKSDTVITLPVKSKLAIDTLHQNIIPGKYVASDDLLYHTNPIFIVWIALVAIMITIAAGSVPFFWEQINFLKSKFNLDSKQMKVARYLTAGLVFLLVTANLYSPGYYEPPKLIDDFHILLEHGILLKVIEGVTILLLVPAIIVVFLTAIASDNISIIQIPKDSTVENYDDLLKRDLLINESRESIEKAAHNFTMLNRILRMALNLLALVVVFSVLTSGVLGKSVNATIGVTGIEIYPSEISIVYGMFFSLMLLVIYVPVFQYLKFRNLQLKSMISEIEKTDIIKNEKWFENIFGTLKFEDTTLDNFKMTLTVMAPLISSFLPEYLHFLK